MHDLQKFFADTARLVEEELDRLIPSEDRGPTTLHKAIRWSVFGGGKRFRPILVFAVGQTFGADDRSLVRTAAAIEMIHTYSLIHDDLPSMDDDDLRRGRATCHQKFGEATAILSGDALQALAFKTIAEDDALDSNTRIRLITHIASAAGTPDGMVGGQQMDLDAEGKDVSRSGVESIHRNKTGALIRASAVSGAVIANANQKDVRRIEQYADDLGLLFQITDDMIDVCQTSEALGKTAGKDVAANKATYPSVYGLRAASRMAGELLAKIESDIADLGGTNSLLVDIARFVLERES